MALESEVDRPLDQLEEVPDSVQVPDSDYSQLDHHRLVADRHSVTSVLTLGWLLTSSVTWLREAHLDPSHPPLHPAGEASVAASSCDSLPD